MHILVTGGCGYVGTILCQHLLENNYRVTVVDAMWFGNYLDSRDNLEVHRLDIRDTDEIPLKGVDVIIHLANIANDPCSDLNPKLSWETNALATMRLADKAARQGVKQFIFASSGSVYGVKEEPEVTEDLSLVPISDYNKSKMVAERVLLSYADSMIIQCIRPATICGYSPRMRLDLSVNMLTMQALTKGEITVFGGSQTRPNINIHDTVRVYLHFLKLGDKAQGIYNAGFENMSIMQIAKTVCELIPARIVVSESDDPRSYRLSSKKLIKTGFQPKYTVVDAIKEIIKVYGENKLRDDHQYYNTRVMKNIQGLT